MTAGFGIASVVFAYLLFRRWLGDRWGLVAAALLAVMRYHLTVSRFGMQAVTTPAFELACLYFVDRAAARRDPRDVAWIGLTLGVGMGFYYALRLFSLVLIVLTIPTRVGIAVPPMVPAFRSPAVQRVMSPTCTADRNRRIDPASTLRYAPPRPTSRQTAAGGAAGTTAPTDIERWDR